MATIWDPSLRAAFAARAARLAQGTVPGWGKMNAGGMMAHLNDSYRMALGELHVKPRNVPLRYPVIKQIVVYALPFPKGVPTAPELISRCDGAVLADEQRAYGGLLTKLATVTPATRLADHPAFGNLTHRAYGVLMARHTEHHFRQFGL